jgi:FkbM family methyltransferase
LFAACFPSTEIHAFEPVASTHAILLRQVSSLPHVLTHRVALGSRDGTAMMEAEPGSGSNRLVAGAARAPGSPTESVPLRRLDSLCEELGLDAISLLKTDCEGHDLAVLQGAESLLRRRRIACVYCEVNFRRDGMHGDFFAIESYLRDLGYGFYALYDYSSREYDVPRVGFANALFIRGESPASAS